MPWPAEVGCIFVNGNGARSSPCSAARRRRGRWWRERSTAIPVIGLIGNWSRELPPSRLPAFRQGLNETGYIEGQSVAIEYRWAEGQFDLMPDLVADLLRRRVTVIATPGLAQAALAAKAATAAIPIVFAVGEDPVKLGLVESLARPGGNLTGVNFFNTELVQSRLDCCAT